MEKIRERARAALTASPAMMPLDGTTLADPEQVEFAATTGAGDKRGSDRVEVLVVGDRRPLLAGPERCPLHGHTSRTRSNRSIPARVTPSAPATAQHAPTVHAPISPTVERRFGRSGGSSGDDERAIRARRSFTRPPAPCGEPRPRSLLRGR